MLEIARSEIIWTRLTKADCSFSILPSLLHLIARTSRFQQVVRVSMSCSGIQPVQLTLHNVSLSNDGTALTYGVPVQIGTPPQQFAMFPESGLNNTWVNSLANCNGGTSNDSCVSEAGGLFNPDVSSTFARTDQSVWNGSSENPLAGFNTDGGVYFNDVMEVNANRLLGFPFTMQPYSGYGNAGLGIGCNSTFMNALSAASLTPSRSYSLYTGVYSDSNAGSLMIGGYADRFYEGQLMTQQSDSTALPELNVVGLVYQTGNLTLDLLAISNLTQKLSVQIEPIWPWLELPQQVFWAVGNATNATLEHVKVSTLVYNTVPASNLTVTLDNGLKTIIPHNALFNPPGFTNSLYAGVRNGSDNPIYSLFASNIPGVYEQATWGIPYACKFALVSSMYESLDQNGLNCVFCAIICQSRSMSNHFSLT